MKNRRGSGREYDRLDPHSLSIIRQALAVKESGQAAALPVTPAPTVVAPSIPELFIPELPSIFDMTIFESAVFEPRPASVGKHTEAVMVIPRFEPKTVGGQKKIVIVKDIQKSTFGFPFGGVETGDNDRSFADKDKSHTAMRETLEEAFGREEFEFSQEEARALGIVICDQNLIGVFDKAPDHTVYVYSFVLPASSRCKLRPGKEQQVVLAVPSHRIDEFIEQGIFLETHAKGWEMYKKLFNKQ